MIPKKKKDKGFTEDLLNSVLEIIHSTWQNSWARGEIGAVAAGLHHGHSNARSEQCLQPIPQLPTNAGSLTHGSRPGVEAASSWMLVGFITAETQQEFPKLLLNLLFQLSS